MNYNSCKRIAKEVMTQQEHVIGAEQWPHWGVGRDGSADYLCTLSSP